MNEIGEELRKIRKENEELKKQSSGEEILKEVDAKIRTGLRNI